ncbi:transposase [Methylocystis iwaonis]|uniref:transposase n=1 Tax=Methylocystis iwaonis TaxID=2885079 RepID=UPI003D9C9EF4
MRHGAPRDRSHRSDAARPRHPLHRHQAPARRAGVALRSLYCARGQAEYLIKLHKRQLSSDRPSCRSALANQVRLVLHTAAFWLMLGVRDAIPKPRDLAKAELSNVAPAAVKDRRPRDRDRERVRLAFAAASPEADLFCIPAGGAAHGWRAVNDGASCPSHPSYPSNAFQKCGSRSDQKAERPRAICEPNSPTTQKSRLHE